MSAPRRRIRLRLLLLGLLPAMGPQDRAAEAVRAGNALYAQGAFEAALERYAEAEAALPGRPEIAFDRATAWARLGESERALEHYMAALASEDPALRGAAKYGIGVVRLRQAMAPEQALGDATWQARAAIRYLRESLELDRGREEARHNLELAWRLLHGLEARAAELRQRERPEADRTTHRRGQALQDLLQNQAGEQQANPDQLEDHRPEASDQTPANFSARESPKQRNDSNLPVAMDPQAAAELIERLLDKLREAESWRVEQRRAPLREPGEREPW